MIALGVLGIEVAAGPDQGNHADGDQHDHGDQQVQNRALAGSGLLIIVSAFKGTLGSGEQVVLDLSVVLMLQHGAVVDVQQRDDNDHHQGQQAVIVPGDLLDEQLNAVDGLGLDIAGHGSSPRGHGSDHAHGSGGSINDVGQLRPGDLVALGNRTHNGAHGQAVEIVVDEDQHAQEHGHQLSAGAGLHGVGSPTTESLGAAALVHQIHHDAKNHQEHNDAHVISIGQNGDDTVVSANQGHSGVPRGKLRIQQSADQAAQEQGRIHFLADQGQNDGHDGGQQGPEGACKGSGRLDHFAIHFKGGQRRVFEADAQDHQKDDEDTESYKIRNFCTFLFHNE